MPIPDPAQERISPCLLIVDDLPGNLGGLLDTLHAADYDVRVAAGGEIALERLEYMQPDLILLDVNMPGLDGYETCRRLKADTRWRDTPVLFLTAQDDPTDKLRGFEAGGVDYITKPLHNEEVLARVRAHLQIRALQQALEEQNELLRAAVNLRLQAEAQLQETLESAVIIVAGEDTIQFCTRPARQFLSKYFPTQDDPKRLPAPLAVWACDAVGTGRWSVGQEASLEARLLDEPQPGRSWLLALEETSSVADSPASLLRLGVTAREAEVLYWIAHGKSNPEIAIILEAALNTIKRHAQSILVKLGVETRLSAALRGAEVLGLKGAAEAAAPASLNHRGSKNKPLYGR